MKKTHAMWLSALMAWAGVTLPASAGETRQIKVTLDDMLRIHPEKTTVKKGETVDFVVHNAGKLRHEFVIGPEEEVDEHAREMQSMGGMDMADMEPGNESSGGATQAAEEELGRVDVKPGKTEHLRYHVKKLGELVIACLYPGHREAGMKGAVTVK